MESLMNDLGKTDGHWLSVVRQLVIHVNNLPLLFKKRKLHTFK